jgi:hypothetical protein
VLVTADYGLRAKTDTSVCATREILSYRCAAVTCFYPQIPVLHYAEVCQNWPQLFQPPSNRIDEEDEQLNPAPTVACVGFSAGMIRIKQEIRCFACREVMAADSCSIQRCN